MKFLKTCTLTLLLSTFSLIQESSAATFSPSILEQVRQVTKWFSGRFDNSGQVVNDPTVPLVTMSNCSVELLNNNFDSKTETIYLEQRTGGNPFRVRLYTVSPGTDKVNLNIYRFLDQTSLLGTCNQSSSERLIDFNNIALASNCNVMLFAQPSRRYIGNNAPNGCSLPSGGFAVSGVEISQREINSLDRIFDANGNLLFGTEIDFRQVNVPEPSVMLGLLLFGAIGIIFKKD